MARLSYGPQAKKRAKRLFEALLNYANDQFEGSERLKIQLNPQTDTQLVIRTKVRFLEQLTKLDGYDGTLNTVQIKEGLKQFKDFLEILEDNRVSTKGSDNWHFTLKLWHKYQDLDANVKRFEREWESRRPEQSKRVMGEISSTAPASCLTITPLPERPETAGDLPHHNLPAPDHTALIGRQQQITQLLELLSFDNPVYRISIEGIAGAGKTTLMLEAARRCLEASRSSQKVLGIPTFEAIIFTSAKPDRLKAGRILPRLQRERTLRDIFRAIATTLGYPDILNANLNEQLQPIQESLSRQPTLLLLDNLETLEDRQRVFSFLYELPPTVKVIITTRVQALLDVSIHLDALPETEGLNLIAHQASSKQVLLEPSDSIQLYQKTGGLPIAIVYTIGQLAAGYALTLVLNRLTQVTGDISYFCFEESVKPLRGKASYNLLMAIALFPKPATESAIAFVAAITDPITAADSFARLQQLSLIKHHQGRYDMLPLTRGYCLAQMPAQPELERDARTRWIRWYLDFSREHGGKDWKEWNEYEYLQKEWENLTEAIEWCIDQNRYADVRQFWQHIKCYSYVRGYRGDRARNWNAPLDWTEWLIENAQLQEDWSTVAEAMFDRAWTLTLIGKPEDLQAADDLFQQAWNLRNRTNITFQINLAIHRSVVHLEQNEFAPASDWLERAQTLLNTERLEEMTATRFLVHILYYQGQICYKTEQYDRAETLFRQTLDRARDIDWKRAIFLTKNWLADIAIQQGKFDEAEELLQEGLRVAELNKDKCRAAFCLRSLAQLERSRSNWQNALRLATEARTSFLSLGMITEADETEEFLRKLQ